MDLHTEINSLQAQLDGLRASMQKEDKGPFVPGRFAKFDEDKHMVYAEVYLPDVEDAHGHSMSAVEIEKMAHAFLANARTTQIDVQHDNNTDYGCYMVESFIARKGDPDYAEGAWVAAVFVGSDQIWKKIKDGEITGFSFEGMGYLIDED